MNYFTNNTSVDVYYKIVCAKCKTTSETRNIGKVNTIICLVFFKFIISVEQYLFFNV